MIQVLAGPPPETGTENWRRKRKLLLAVAFQLDRAVAHLVREADRIAGNLALVNRNLRRIVSACRTFYRELEAIAVNFAFLDRTIAAASALDRAGELGAVGLERVGRFLHRAITARGL